ncbi:hypothetical protein [Streptomyces youssoufiensis]
MPASQLYPGVVVSSQRWSMNFSPQPVHTGRRASRCGPTLVLFRFGADGLAAVESLAVGVVERGPQRLLARPS